jgi:PAS domain S-box-containing protein
VPNEESGRPPAAAPAEPARASDERYRLALEATGHAYFEYDTRSARIVAGTPWTAAGYGPGDLSPMFESWMPLVHPDDRVTLLDGMEAQRRGVSVSRIEYRVRGKGGEWRSLLVSSRVLSRDLDGQPIHVVGTMTDVTDARAMRERLLVADRLASLGALAAGVAHAVNNPLATVASSLRTLEEELERLQADPAQLARRLPELRQEASDGAQGAAQVREVVRALQLFASPRAAGPREPVDVRAELEGAVALTRNAVGQRARVEVELPPSLPAVVAVPGELGQAFLNLLLEAAQAIPEGRPAEHEVRISARAAGAEVTIEVRDTGADIVAERLPRAFEPFFAARPRAAGAGLGLSVCHGVVTAAGGTIALESAPGRGATFRVTLPAAPAPPPARPAAAPVAAPRGRVLVIDDDALVGRSMGRLLQGAHDVAVLTSPVDALASVERGERWDAILCDLMMPELSGMDLEERIARAAPDLVPRVIYLTGGAFTDRARQFLAEGRPFLEKPVDAAVLRERVAELVRRPR